MSALADLAEVIARLRRECSWTAGQTHRSLARYLLEETYEALDAIDADDSDHLREELGDLLLQVFLHAEIAAQDGRFTLGDVAADLVAKLVRRNPHVFGDGQDPHARTPEAINEQWDRIKAAEKDRSGLVDGIPEELPALLRAVKVLDRLDRAGVVPTPDPGAGALGDRLLALAAEARREGVDPEQELRAAVRRLITSAGPEGFGAAAAGNDVDAGAPTAISGGAAATPGPDVVVTVRRSGGFGGMIVERTATLSHLEPDLAAAWRDLLDSDRLGDLAGRATSLPPRADAFTYAVRCAALTVELPEPVLPADVQELLERVLDSRDDF